MQQPEVPDDLQDLINAVVYESPRSSTEEALQSARLAPEDQEDLTFASKSSFEGNISTATEAAALALQKMLEGPATIGRSSNEQTIGRPSFDETTGRSSFETNFGRKSLDDGRPSYETHRTSFEYEEPKQRGTESCRSSFNRYMEMGRPSVGARMLDDIDFVVALDPLVSFAATTVHQFLNLCHRPDLLRQMHPLEYINTRGLRAWLLLLSPAKNLLSLRTCLKVLVLVSSAWTRTNHSVIHLAQVNGLAIVYVDTRT